MRRIGQDALILYARRELDAASAATRVCAAVLESGGELSRCALIAVERMSAPVLAGVVDDDEATTLTTAVDIASPRRLILDRAADDRGLFSKLNAGIDWIAVEPVIAKNGAPVGALAAMGTRSVLNDVLAVLPAAALIIETIAFELLCQSILGRRLHRFNNLLAKLSANVEQLASLISEKEGELDPSERDEVLKCAAFATTEVGALLAAGADLRDALPLRR